MLTRQPLSLVTNNELNIRVLFEEQTQHQTKTTAKAVWQRGHGASDNIVKPLSDKQILREALIKRLANVVPTMKSSMQLLVSIVMSVILASLQVPYRKVATSKQRIRLPFVLLQFR